MSRAAAIWFYTATSLGTVLFFVVAIGGIAFGEDAARGAIAGQLKCGRVLPTDRRAGRRDLDRLLDARHGWALVAKVLVVLGALALALWNRLRHTPALERGADGTGTRLATSIRMEIVIALLAFYAAAEMVCVHPADYGHRVEN